MYETPNINDVSAGIFTDYIKPLLTPDFLMNVLIIVLSFLALSEVPKTLMRRNIGRKAINIYGITWSAILYSLLAIVYILSIVVCTQIVREEVYYFKHYRVIPYFMPLVLFWCFLAFYAIKELFEISGDVFKNGKKLYLDSQIETSQDFRVLEYRGESNLTKGLLERGVAQNTIWRKSEPIYYLKDTFKTHKNPLILIPLLITGIAFLFNEWYQVYYKVKRAKERYMDMKIEMQKSTMFYNQTGMIQEISRVEVD